VRTSRATLCALTLLAAATAAAGTLRGRVELVEKDGRKAKDAADAVVWVEGPKVTPPPSTATVVMKGKTFVPRVVVVGVDGAVAFPNQDGVLHNVFSVSGENRFDLDLYKKPKSASWRFRHPGLVRVYCNIHPQMSAFVVVRDNPFWARPGPDGRFEIPEVPPGDWVVKAWHERSGESSQAVTVTGDGVAEVPLTLDASRWKRSPHKNKYGQDYKTGDRY
jgi:plastocyanin